MRLKNIALAGLALVATLSVSAQDAKTEYEFNPHWYIQGQIGGQYTLGEGKFGDLLSPNIQISGGYNFNQVFGLRFGINAWQSKSGWDNKWDDQSTRYDWKWNYVAPVIDVVSNLSNVFGGYKPNRIFDLSAFIGIGVNIAFNNDEALDINNTLFNTYNQYPIQNCWSGSKAFLLGRAGLMGDFHINDNLSLGLELNATILGDKYNSKNASNGDWYFAGLVGVKYCFGKTNKAKPLPVPVCGAGERERIVEKIVEKEVPGPVREIRIVEPLRQNIYFAIGSSKVSLKEMQKVKELAAYLKKYPDSKIQITGYADKGSGTAAVNLAISKERADAIAEALTEEFGIDQARISVEAKGDTEELHNELELNRAAICIVK